MLIIFILIKLVILFTVLILSTLIFKKYIVSDLKPLLMFKTQKALGASIWIFLVAFSAVLFYQSKLQLWHASAEYLKNKQVHDLRGWFEEYSTLKGGIFDRRHLPEKQLAKFEQDPQSGVIKRIYPLGPATFHLLGYSDINRSRSGLEKDFLDKLMGRSNGSLAEIINHFKNVWFRMYPKGNDLVLTIDYDLQKYAYELLAAQKHKGAIVILEPDNGYVLAMASYPSVDPLSVSNDSLWNVMVKDKKNAPLLNRAIKGRYPPGSIFKIAIAAAALERRENPKLYCGPEKVKFRGYRKRLGDHGDTHHGWLKMDEAIKQSCNQYFGQLGVLLTPEIVEQRLAKLGFNQTVEWNSSSDAFQQDFRIFSSTFPKAVTLDSFRTAWASIGQDQVLVTPMQMALLAAAVANNGKLPRPCLEIGRWSKSHSQAFSSATARKLKKMMTAVVEDGGTGYTARIPGLPMAGKTGTAEVARGRPHSWFISFAPADDPKIAMAVICENSGYGASVAAPISKKLYVKAIELGYLEKRAN